MCRLGPYSYRFYCYLLVLVELILQYLGRRLYNQTARMIQHVQNIEKSKIYRIRNRKINQYLTSGPEVRTSERVLGKIQQLWLIEEVKPTVYEIVSLQSGQVLSRREQLVVEKGNWSSCQFWKFQRAEIRGRENYYWIMAQEDERSKLFATCTSSKAAMKNMDQTLFVCNWEIETVNLDIDLSGCCILKSHLSGLVVDVPEGSDKPGLSIIQYHCNGRGNQRWVFERVNNCFVIRNLCTNMVLTPQNRTLKTGTKIVQAEFLNNMEEKWVVEEEVKDKYLVRNAGDLSLFLGVSSTRESSAIIVTNDKQKALWDLQGSIPQIKQVQPA